MKLDLVKQLLSQYFVKKSACNLDKKKLKSYLAQLLLIVQVEKQITEFLTVYLYS